MKKVEKFKIVKSNFDNWEDVFNNPSVIKISTFKTGEITAKISGLINLKHKNAVDVEDGKISIPVLAHVISHEKFGNFLIDTGFDSSFSKVAGGRYKGILKKMILKNSYVQDNYQEGIDFQIKDINLSGVFLTHMHEHSAGSESLSDELPFIYGSGEKEINIFPLVYTRFLKNKVNKKELDFSKANDMPILEKCIDVFGDGSFWAISTSGHTKGHVSYIVNGIDRKVFVAGDICSIKKSYDLRVGMGSYSEDVKKCNSYFEKFYEFTKKYSNIEIFYGHETEEYKL